MIGDQAVRPAHRRRQSLGPALLAAAALHFAVFLIATFAPRPDMASMGSAVPITIVARGPTTDSRPAQAAPQTAAAQTETPVPEAKAPAPPPAPEEDAPAPPVPQPPPAKAKKPRPQPKPTPPKAPAPRPVKPAPAPKLKTLAPTKPTRATPRDEPAPDTLNLDALAAQIARARRSSPPRPALAARGPARAETALAARVDAGQGVSQSDISGLSQLLERLWNPNCNVAGGDAVVIPVKFTIGEDGHVVGQISEGGRDASANPVMSAAARRAIDAIHQAEPYGAVYRGKAFTVNFDAKTACANR